MSKPRGLGRGFDALIPTDMADIQSAVGAGEVVQKVNPSQIQPNPHQPRTDFDPSELQNLAQSIKQHGIVQPLVVSKKGDRYELIAGERRLRAAKLLGLSEVPVIERSFDEQQKLELALIENLQRADLNPIETAAAYRKLIDEFNQSIESISKQVGQAQSTISNIMRLLNLPKAAREAVAKGQISEAHGRAILSVDDPAKRLQLLELIVKNGWTVRQAEEFARAFKAPTGSKESGFKRIAGSNPLTEDLGGYLKTKVALQPTAKGGKLIIDYASEEDLERIYKTIKP